MLSMMLAIILSAGKGAAAEGNLPMPDLKQAMADAAGAALVEVVSTRETDQRPVDGNLFVQAELKILKSSGLTLRTLTVVKKHGGMRPPPGAVKLPPFVSPLKPDSLLAGKQYWILFASPLDERYVQRVVAFWPSDNAGVAKSLTEAIEKDRYLWQPRFSRKTGLTVERLEEPQHKRWRIRMSRGDKLLWEKVIEGSQIKQPYDLWLDVFDHLGGPGAAADIPKDTPILYFTTDRTLQADKEAGIQAGRYWVEYVFDAVSGRLIAETVRAPQPSHVQHCQRSYDIETGRLTVLDIFTMQTNGKAVGAESDNWLRHESRRYDKKTRKLESIRFFRSGPLTPYGPTGWIPVPVPATQPKP
ncbi:MAG: hypothetical protein ABFD92_10880 [Planctomycetaceae bacterium]|nr:hypothetical protein [Planctomycetaceae bacterium]